MKKKLCIGICCALTFSMVEDFHYCKGATAEQISVSEANAMIREINNELEEIQKENLEEYLNEITETDEFESEIAVESVREDILEGNVECLDRFVEGEEQEALKENILEECTVTNIEELSAQEFINPNTGKVFENVEEVELYYKKKGYAIDTINCELYEKIEEIEEVTDCNMPEMVVEVNNQIIEEYGNEGWVYGTVTKASRKYQETYEQWTALTQEEKVLVITDPKKAVAAKVLAEKAYEMTAAEFGYNGLGDKSDGFRHGVWNALMCRDTTKTWAKMYATAHESGKTKAQLAKKAKDGYTERKHRSMDLHNNKIGRSVMKWYDTVINVSDNQVKSRIKKKLNNKKKTGIYWLHS